MKKGKNITRFILVALVFGVGAFFLFGKQTELACSDHLGSAHSIVNEMYSSMTEVPFDEYFYSPSLNTCVAGIVKLETKTENEMYTSYLIIDTLKGKELYGKIGFRYSEPQNEREREMTKNDIGLHGVYLAELSKLRH